MRSLQEQIDAELEDATSEDEKHLIVAKARAKVCVEMWENHGAKNDAGIATFRVGRKDVTIGHVEYTELDGVPAVEVWTGVKEGSPAFRIINPPTMVPDPDGSVEVDVHGSGVRRFRGDPIAALAYTIGGSKR